jgi:hypothetical protein
VLIQKQIAKRKITSTFKWCLHSAYIKHIGS